MTVLNIQIRLDNSAFEEGYLETEIHDILGSIQCKILKYQRQSQIYDSNGNNIGQFKIEE